jgi:autotransporter-associated beta strand protein
MRTKLITFLILNFSFFLNAYADSATWNLNPTSGDWNTAANWTPPTVPNGPTDVATFARSSIKSLRFSGAMTEVAEIVFNQGANTFKIIADSSLAQTNVTLSISGPGLTNNSGVTQNLVAGPSVFPGGVGIIEFLNAATAGDGTVLTALGSATDGAFGGSVIYFYDTSTAGNASIVAEGARGRDDAGGGNVFFYNNATAANATFTATGSMALGGGGGEIFFTDDSTAANATFTIEGGSNGGLEGEVTFSGNSQAATAQFTVVGGDIIFFDNSSAADATLTIEGAAVSGGSSGLVSFDFGGTAGNGVFIINGGSTSGAGGGSVGFLGSSTGNPTAGNATLIANSGTNGGAGGQINFSSDDQSEARIELFGNGALNLNLHTGVGEVGVGSVEGDGLIVLSTNQELIIGNNDLSTTFSGTIQDFGSGSLEKVGTGTLTLTGANTYTRGTALSGGTLVINNTTGSGTGTGAVNVNAGTLGGKGTIAGVVTVGTGSGAGAFLEPSVGVLKTTSMSIQSALTLKADSTYTYKLNTSRAKADKVIANGVTIDSGAQFNFVAAGNNTLSPGKVFVAMSNTAVTPISGTFANLPDGSTFTVGPNTFQVSYEGGDGNDLTLTVIP